MKTGLLSAAVAALLLTASAAAATTYVASRAVGTGFVDLSITTDDTLGILASANILDWDITVTQGADVFSIEGPGGANNSKKLIAGSALTATASDLYFDFDGPDFSVVLFQSPVLGSGQTFWCLQTSACFSATAPAEGLRGTLPFEPESIALRHGNQVIASVAPVGPPTGGVPEPAGWALMILGFSAVGALLRRRATATA